MDYKKMQYENYVARENVENLEAYRKAKNEAVSLKKTINRYIGKIKDNKYYQKCCNRVGVIGAAVCATGFIAMSQGVVPESINDVVGLVSTAGFAASAGAFGAKDFLQSKGAELVAIYKKLKGEAREVDKKVEECEQSALDTGRAAARFYEEKYMSFVTKSTAFDQFINNNEPEPVNEEEIVDVAKEQNNIGDLTKQPIENSLKEEIAEEGFEFKPIGPLYTIEPSGDSSQE